MCMSAARLPAESGSPTICFEVLHHLGPCGCVIRSARHNEMLT